MHTLETMHLSEHILYIDYGIKITFISSLQYSRFISHLCPSLSESTCEIKALNPEIKAERRKDNYQDETGHEPTQ